MITCLFCVVYIKCQFPSFGDKEPEENFMPQLSSCLYFVILLDEGFPVFDRYDRLFIVKKFSPTILSFIMVLIFLGIHGESTVHSNND